MTTYDEVLSTIQKLSSLDKVRLLEDVSAALRQDLIQQESTQPRRSLYGVWAGKNVSDADIDAVRREAWDNFPREVI